MHKIIMVAAIILMHFVALTAGGGYEIQPYNNTVDVMYQTEISSSVPMWINWSTADLAMSGKVKIGLPDDGGSYYLCVIKIR